MDNRGHNNYEMVAIFEATGADTFGEMESNKSKAARRI